MVSLFALDPTPTPAPPNVVIPDLGGSSSCVQNNGTFCWGWFKDNWGGTFAPAVEQHIVLCVIAVAIGFVIAFALALLAHQARWLATPFTFLGSLLYTIPSLAAFEILLPITGIGYLTIEIPLVGYTLLVLFTNTLAGLSSVTPEIIDAARGVGLTRRQVLIRVEIPLAVPAIVAGLRIAIVTTISLATVAAYLVPKGLGKPIFDALATNDFYTKFIGAGVLCILLALIADGLFVVFQRLLTPWSSSQRKA